MALKYQRILIKISGEALAGDKHFGLNFDVIGPVCDVIKKCNEEGCEIGIVVGGGNFWRGRTSEHMDRTRADHIGMLATAMNSLALCDALEQLGADVRVQTAIEMRQIAEPYIRNKAIRHFQKGRIVIFGCGTDTAAALRAVEINADVLLKATNVDGVYDKDPNKFDDAVKFDNVTFKEVLAKDIKVMDSTAFSLCKDNDLSILVFDLTDPENIVKAVSGEAIGTLVQN